MKSEQPEPFGQQEKVKGQNFWLKFGFFSSLLLAVSAIVFAMKMTDLSKTNMLMANVEQPLPPPPKRAEVPTLDEIQLAAKVISNAVDQPEAMQHIQLVYSLRNQQHLTKLAQLQAEQARSQADIARARAEQQKLVQDQDQGQKNDVVVPNVPDPLEQLRLSSIVAKKDGTYKAIVIQNGRRQTVRQGDTLGEDIRVDTLTYDRITFSRRGKKKNLYLD